VNHPHDQLAAFVDGELGDTEAQAFSVHLAGCAECRAALHDNLQLMAFEVSLRHSSPALHVPLTASAAHAVRPRWRRPRAIAVMAAAAALAVIAGVWWWSPGGSGSPVVLTSAQVRPIEGRLSYAGADRYRPYDVVRADAPGAARIDVTFDALAQLERRGDFHGIAAASLLAGDPTRAAAYLERATGNLDVAADRALLALSSGDPREAVIRVDDVLTANPRHPQALWNRALALRELGLPQSSAAAFEAVAALGEPGWADEARRRGQELSTRSSERRTAYLRLANTDVLRLATGPDAVTAEAARRFPGMARVLLYDAIRGAGSADAVRALAPLARTLDDVYGEATLAAYIERVARADFTVRAPLAARYAALVSGAQLDDAAIRDLVSALRAGRADDILFGALVFTSRRGLAPADVAELRRFADTAGDPWLRVLAVERAAAARIAQHDHVGAEAIALPVLATCETSRLDYRCASLALTLVQSYVYMFRLADAQQVLARHIDRVRRGGEWYLEDRFVALSAQLEMLSDDVAGTTLPIARAYLDELGLREPETCAYQIWGHEMIALLFVNRFDLSRAGAALQLADAAVARCTSASPQLAVSRNVESLFVASHVLRAPTGGTAADVARVRAQIDHARQAAGPGMRSMLDQVEGRLLIDRDRATATNLLERAIAQAEGASSSDINGPKAREYAYTLLTLDAARAGEWASVWRLHERAAGITASPRCAMGIAADDGASATVVRDASGAVRGWFSPMRPDPTINVARLVPAEVRDALRGCLEVEVLARPPVQGLPELLPIEFAWSFRVGAGAGSTLTPSVAHRATQTLPPASGPASLPARRVVIANAEPPAALRIARLSPWRSAEPPHALLEGRAATPSRALAEMSEATFVEIHAHGKADASGTDAAFVMLSPESDGHYALTAAAIRQRPLRGRPIVILAACQAAKLATYRHEAWSLPASFIVAGARAVIASSGVIEDAGAGELFDDVRARIERGSSPAVALRDARAVHLANHPTATWVRAVMVFQ
jgi:hypothetical protein